MSEMHDIKWTAQTSPGRYRRNNEDSFLLMMFDERELCFLGKEGAAPTGENHFIFAVSDGIGGAEAGEYASQSALRSISDLISREFHRGKKRSQLDYSKMLTAFCEQIHHAILKVSSNYKECCDMGATLSIGWIHQSVLYFAHLGDSRIYHLPSGASMTQLSEDHTVAARKVREGKLTTEEAKRHSSNNVLEKSIGSGRGFSSPQLGQLALSQGDRLVFCTDGVADGITPYTVEKTVLNPPPYLKDLNPAEAVVKEALDASGKDNITAIVIEFCH
jgi:serine/threonine protein phosphatase PrpC